MHKVYPTFYDRIQVEIGDLFRWMCSVKWLTVTAYWSRPGAEALSGRSRASQLVETSAPVKRPASADSSVLQDVAPFQNKITWPLRGGRWRFCDRGCDSQKSGASGPYRGGVSCLAPPCSIGLQHQLVAGVNAAPSCQQAELLLWSPTGKYYSSATDAPAFVSLALGVVLLRAPRFYFNASRAPPRLQLQASQGVCPPETSWPAVGLQEVIHPLAAMTICCRWRRRRPCTVPAGGHR